MSSSVCGTQVGEIAVQPMATLWPAIIESFSRWWQLTYFLFSPLFGEDEPILTNIFQQGLKPPTRF